VREALELLRVDAKAGVTELADDVADRNRDADER
jgi:hypothetical protein